MSPSVRDRLQAGLRDAMKQRDKVAVGALRSALGAIANAEAVPDTIATSSAHPIAVSVRGLGAGEAPRRPLSEAEVRDVVDAEIDDRLVSAHRYDDLGQGAAADALRSEAAVLRSYLGA
ncbi:MAG TPA: hypothetical protein VH986_15065 [Acidimicrobiia bacterium]|jgi:hypothetical protein